MNPDIVQLFLDPAAMIAIDRGPHPVVWLVYTDTQLGFAHARWMDIG